MAEPIDDPSSSPADLVVALMAAQSRDIHHTQNALLYAVESDRNFLAEALVELVDGLARIPAFARTVYIERLLQQAEVAYARACDHQRAPHSYSQPRGEQEPDPR